jgi:hypothetical protein
MLSRREWVQLIATGALAPSLSGWLGQLASGAASPPRGKVKSCILLWMSGGPSQIDTFDPKPDHANGGGVKAIATSAPGLQISENLPQVAKWGEHLAVIRSMSTKEGDHGRATHYLRTGYFPGGGLTYPSLGALVSKEKGDPESSLPRFVSIAPTRFFNSNAFSSGFLGPLYAPLVVGETPFGRGLGDVAETLRVKDLEPPPLADGVVDHRVGLLRDLEKDFAAHRPDLPSQSHQAAYERAVKLMKSPARKAFQIDQEKPSVRDSYGRTLFGQGCLLARRLVEHGVPFVEVSLANNGNLTWDTHDNNKEQCRTLCGVLDPAWATLMSDLKERGLLESTLIVWMGEFGRTPAINTRAGRDHWPTGWSAVLAGGGIQGGGSYGATSAGGGDIIKDPVGVPDFLATVMKALDINPEGENKHGARPIKLVDRGFTVLEAILKR